MSFTATLSRNGKIALITLEGELDAITAPTFIKEVERAGAEAVDQLVLEMSNLRYLSSAGLRGLVFARQKMADDVRLVLVGANEAIQRTVRLVGFQYSVDFSDRIPG
jgi:anti-anti-sigma factor